MQALARRIVTEILARADVRIGGGRPWDVTVHDDRFYTRTLRGSLGLGESYMDGDWDTRSLIDFFRKTLGSGLRDHPLLRLNRLGKEVHARLGNLQTRHRSRAVAELVREQLLAVTRDELPYSIATQVTEWEWPRIRVDIVVERESQKGMVIGKGGSVLKRVGEQVRRQLPDGVYLELRVKVDKDWQRRPDRVERLGY